MDERISFDEAVARGYRRLKVGWNHRLNKPIMAELWQIRGLCGEVLSVKALEDAARLMMEPPYLEPAGDIPMVI